MNHKIIYFVTYTKFSLKNSCMSLFENKQKLYESILK